MGGREGEKVVRGGGGGVLEFEMMSVHCGMAASGAVSSCLG